MPSGKQLGIGLGIKAGVDGFLNSFYQAKGYEMQEKQQQNAVILNAVMAQLQDETVPLYERSKILDSIPNLVGAKLKVPLSQMLHLDEYNKHLTEDPNQPAVAGSQGEKGGVLSSTETNSPNAGQTLQLKDIQTNPAVAAGMIERGNLSVAQIKAQLVKAQNAANDASDIDKQTKILTLQYNLQKNILGKGGYTQQLPATFDTEGNLIVRFMRPADGEVITKNLGKVSTEALEKAKIQNDPNRPKGNLGQLFDAHQIVDAYEKDPTAYPESQYKASKELIDNFNLTGQLKKSQIASLNQGITGNPPKPITPAQSADDARANQQMQISLQTSLDNARSTAIQSSEHAASQANISQQFYDNNIAPLKAQMEAALKDADGDTTDTDYLRAQKQYNAANSNWLNGTKKLADLAKSADISHQANLKAVEERLNQFSQTGQAPSNSSINKNVTKAQIDFARRKNPDKTKNMSDQDIISEILRQRAAGKIK